jgi:2-polyprenyl-3-methyl-5-hydroxy-6-metoxy-1,4-benzoquinol methylase
VASAGFDALRYWEQRLTEHYSLNGVGTIGLGESYLRWMYRVRRVVFERTVTEFLRADLRVLDVGSGTGFYVDSWRRLGVMNLVGSDLTQQAVRRLSERYPAVRFVRWQAGSGEPPFTTGCFDAISAMDVLFHIVDDEKYRKAVRDLALLLAPGGVLVLSENFLHTGEIRAEHQVSRPLHSVAAAIEDAGMSVVKRRPMFVLMNEPVDGRSRLWRPWWSLVRTAGAGDTKCAGVLGAALYPLELGLVRLFRDGPSTEIAICRLA